MSESEFHGIGVAVGAPAVSRDPLLIGAALGIQYGPEFDEYVAEVCANGPTLLILPKIFSQATDVPAYEALFKYIATQCNVPTYTLDALRGRVASSIVQNQAFIANLDAASQTAEFCGSLDDTSDITTGLIGAAADELNISDTRGKLLEIGVELMIKGCPELLGRVTGG